jgi:hypothetical protein
MDTLLWIAQALVALLVTLAGGVKLFSTREQLAVRMHWAASWPRERIKLLGFAEVAGGAGLVLPLGLGIAPYLTPIAALCLAVLMGGAVHTHLRLHERFVPAAAILILCLGIAAGRFVSLSV